MQEEIRATEERLRSLKRQARQPLMFRPVRSRQEIGAMGAAAQLEVHGAAQVRRFRSQGGRKRNPTLAEIQATTGRL